MRESASMAPSQHQYPRCRLGLHRQPQESPIANLRAVLEASWRTVQWVQALAAITVTPELRATAHDLVDRLRPAQLIVLPRWQSLVTALRIADGEWQIPSGSVSGEPVLLVGPPAAVSRHAETSSGAFGFVTVVAQIAKPWQRATSWRDETTLDLWKQGWSPVTVDRVLVPGPDATLEFLIAAVRATPDVAEAD